MKKQSIDFEAQGASGKSVESEKGARSDECGSGDKLDAEIIAKKIAERGIACGKVEVFDTIDSTNLKAKRFAEDEARAQKRDGGCLSSDESGEIAKRKHALFVADCQTAGHGRMGRAFSSPAGSGVYFSLLYFPQSAIEDPAIFTVSAAVAVCRAVEELYGVPCQIKWVNDIYVRGKKICGILAEGIADSASGKLSAIVVGIGINVKHRDFPGEIAQTAASIEDFVDASAPKVCVSRNELAANIISGLLKIYALQDKSANDKAAKDSVAAIIKEYQFRANSFLAGKRVTVNPLVSGAPSEKPYGAIVKAVNSNAELIVIPLAEDETPLACEKTLRSGEVSLRL